MKGNWIWKQPVVTLLDIHKSQKVFDFIVLVIIPELQKVTMPYIENYEETSVSSNISYVFEERNEDASEIGNASEMNQSILLPLIPAQIGPSSISTTTINAQHISGNVGACTNLQEPALSSTTNYNSRQYIALSSNTSWSAITKYAWAFTGCEKIHKIYMVYLQEIEYDIGDENDPTSMESTNFSL